MTPVMTIIRLISSLLNSGYLFESWRDAPNFFSGSSQGRVFFSPKTFIAQRKGPGDFSSGPSLYYFFQCRLLWR